MLYSPSNDKTFTGPAAAMRDEQGAVSIWMLFWSLAFLTLGGIAVDTSQAWRVKTMLQSAADASAFAGALALAEGTDLAVEPTSGTDVVETALDIIDDVLTNGTDGLPLPTDDRPDPVDVALAMAERNLPSDFMGQVLLREDVALGIWDPVHREFIESDVIPNAIRVRLRRAHRNDNQEPTFLLKLMGFLAWDIEVEAVARTFISPRAECADPILTARTRVDLQTNNVYVGICVHAKATATADTGADWLSDTVIDLVDEIMLATLQPYHVGNSGSGNEDLAMNVGLETGDGTSPHPLDRYLSETNANANLTNMVAKLEAHSTTTIDRDGLDFMELAANATYHVTCNDNQALYIPGSIPINDVVILSDCPIKVAQDARLSSTILISNLEALKHITLSVQTPTGVELEPQDQCLPGDGVKVLVFVDAETAARFTLFDPEVYPLGDILVSAQREGGSPDAPVDVAVGIDLDNEFLTGAVIEELLGVCLGAKYMLEVNAFALAQ